MRLELQTVIDHNRRLQAKAQELNVRAGEEVCPLMHPHEWQAWLVEHLNGARSVSEVEDYDGLKLPELDEALVQKVYDDNPEQLMIKGQTLNIVYGLDPSSGPFCRTDVTEEFARSAGIEAIELPGGRTVQVRCSGHYSDSLKGLVDMLELQRIDQCWREARAKHDANPVTELQVAISWIKRAGIEVTVTRTNNGVGESVYGYLTIKYNSWGSWEVVVANSELVAKEETQKSLQAMLKATCSEVLVVPDEEPWKIRRAWSHETTALGKALERRLEQLLKEKAIGLTAENFTNRIETLKAAVKQAMIEYNPQERQSVSQVEDAKLFLKKAREKVQPLIEAVDHQLVRKDIELVQEMLLEAKSFLEDSNIAGMAMACDEAVRIAESLSGYNELQKQLRQEAEEARDRVQEDLSLISQRQGKFSKADSDDDEWASILLRNIESSYASAQFEQCIELASDAGQFIATILKRFVTVPVIKAPVIVVQPKVVEPPKEGGKFTFASGRYFMCSCGCQERVTKGDMRQYKAGDELSITCTACKKTGIVQKVVDSSDEKSDEDDSGNGSGLSDLKKAWGLK